MVLLTALLLVGPAAAQSNGLHVQVAGLTLTGEVQADGTLMSFASLQGQPADATGNRLAPVSFELTASHLHVETDVQTAQLNPANPVFPKQSQDPAIDMEDAFASAVAPRGGFSFYVIPETGTTVHVHVDSNALDVRPATSAAEPERFTASQRPAWTAPAGDGVGLGQAVRTVRISGDVRLEFWEYDLEMRNATATATATSGQTYEATVPSVDVPTLGDVATVGTETQRQVFVTASDAVLQVVLPVGASAQTAVRLDNAALSGRATLLGPQATAGSSATPHQGDWVEGRLDLAFSDPGTETFGVTIAGKPTAASYAGLMPQPAGAGFAWQPMAALLVLVAGTAVAVDQVLVRRQLRKLRAAMAEGRHEAVVALSTPRLMRLRRHGDGVRSQRTVALLLLGRIDEAGATLGGWRSGPQATADYLWACVHALRGETQAAAARVEACVKGDPDLARELLGDPLLRSLNRRPAQTRADGYA